MTRAESTSLTAARRPGGGALWVTIGAYLGLMFAASAPSALYFTYEQRWHFSAITLTTVFGIYAIVLLVTLLTVGGLSDFVGRKPVLLAGFGILLASMVIFAEARGVGWLYAGRIVQGVGAGTLMGALSATIIDHAGPHRQRLAILANGVVPSLGLALGVLGAGALVQFAPAPRVLVYLLLAGLFAVVLLVVAVGPEPVARRPGARRSLIPRVSVPRSTRRMFFAITPACFAPWAQLGLALSLTTSLAATEFGITDTFAASGVVALMTGTAFLASVLVRSVRPRLNIIGGCVAMILGNAVLLLSLVGPSTVLFYAGSTICGAGIGATLGAVIALLSALPAPAERGEFFAGVYAIGYLAFSLPAVIAGVCTVQFGLVRSTVGCDLALIGLIGLALVNVVVMRVGLPARTVARADPQPVHG